MKDIGDNWRDTVIRAAALAARLEGEGQYNVAKLLRGAVDAALRKAAHGLVTPTDRASLAREVERAAEELSSLDVGAELAEALRRGGEAISEGRLPLIDETPHPYVCRTCGHVSLGEADEKCSTCGAKAATFQEFLPVYWLDDLEPFEALTTLGRTLEEITPLLEGLSEEELGREPAEGAWSLRRVIIHMRDAQGVLTGRLDHLLREEDPVITSEAVFEWETGGERETTREIFDTYRASRSAVIERLEAVPLRDWWRTGRHEEFGRLTVRQQVSYFAAHESTHFPQMESIRARLLGDRG
jgi:uncharacterized damage-inducible protein DinB